MADHMILWLGSSSGVRPLHIFFTPALKSTSTPSRSQNILYLDDGAVVVLIVVVTIVDVVSLEVVVVLLREVVPKYPERDCCVFACLDDCCCCCCCCGRDGRLDMMSNGERSGASEGIDEVPLKQLNPKVL